MDIAGRSVYACMCVCVCVWGGGEGMIKKDQWEKYNLARTKRRSVTVESNLHNCGKYQEVCRFSETLLSSLLHLRKISMVFHFQTMFRWHINHDLDLLREVMALRPSNSNDWNLIADNLQRAWTKDEITVKGRSCKEHFDVLLRNHKDEDSAALKKYFINSFLVFTKLCSH